MPSLFQRTFIAFLAGFALLLIILAAALAVGYRQSLSVWSQRREGMVEQSAREMLQDRSGAGRETSLPTDTPVFVYDEDGNIVAASHGRRRHSAVPSERRPVRSENRILGYYTMGPTAFRNDAANRALITALLRAAVVGAFVAFAAALTAAWGFSRSISAPAARVARGIDSIARGRPVDAIQVGGTAEIAQIARAANVLAERLHSEQELRAQWAQDVTHDVRTPVASIRSQLEAIMDGVYQAEPRRIAAALKELSRVEELIDDLDELMRLEEPNRSINRARFAARDFADALVQRFDSELRQKRVSWAVQIDVEYLIGDEGLLFRAVSNLAANAIRHAVAGSTIEFRIIRQTEAVVIQVENQGDPIPTGEIPRLFERLYRGEYARGSRGSGLGLTIAQRIVRLHDGRISLTSSNAGTTASILMSVDAAENTGYCPA